LSEWGLDDFDLTQWYALFAPRGTSPEIVDKINQTLNEVLNDAEVRARMAQDGAQVKTSTPQQLSRHVQLELLRWRKVIASTGLSSDKTAETAEI
jgi:tripartite-type tricarboxylate transporter receptor subunit TctC